MSSLTQSMLRDAAGTLLLDQMYDRLWDKYVPYQLPFLTAVSLGLVNGYTRASAIGYNPDIDTAAVPEDCWGGDGLFPWFASATQCQIRSTSALDTFSGGTGLQTLVVNALDTNLTQAPVTLQMNGTTAVQLPATIGASNGLTGMLAGSLGTNAGDIILEDTVGGQMRGIILAGQGISGQAPYTVPAGFTLIVPQMFLDLNSPGGAVNQFAQMRTFFKGPNNACARRPLIIGTTNSGPYPHQIDPPIVLPEKFRMSQQVTVVSDNNTIVTVGWNGALRQNIAPVIA